MLLSKPQISLDEDVNYIVSYIQTYDINSLLSNFIAASISKAFQSIL